MKIETTCRCINELVFEDYHGEKHKFLPIREYQVDETYTNGCVTYVVYLTGGFDLNVTLSKDEFREYFKLI